MLRLIGVAVGGLSVSKVSRLSRSGKELVYFRVVGPVAAIQSLETQRHMLSSRGWRVRWGDAVGLGKGNERRSWDARRSPSPCRKMF